MHSDKSQATIFYNRAGRGHQATEHMPELLPGPQDRQTKPLAGRCPEKGGKKTQPPSEFQSQAAFENANAQFLIHLKNVDQGALSSRAGGGG